MATPWHKTAHGRALRAANQRLYRQRHPDRVKAQIEVWQEAHPEYERDRARRRYAADPTRQHAATRRWEKSHPQAHKAVRRRANAVRRAAKAGVSIETRLTIAQWHAILATYEGRCAYCFDVTPEPHQDHVVALSRGGHHVASNVVPACASCNHQKRNKSLGHWLFPERGAA